MKIAVNSYISTKGISGSAVGTRIIENSLARLGHEVVTIAPLNLRTTKLERFFYLIAWDLWIFSSRAKKIGAQVLIHTCNTGLSARQVHSLLVIHDTMVLDLPSYFNRGYQLYSRLMFSLSAKNSKLIMTPSETSKRSITNRWPNKKVVVNYWPARHIPVKNFVIQNDEWNIMWNAGMEKHKNHKLLLEIVMSLRDSLGDGLKLHIVTRKGNAWKRFEEDLRKIPDWNRWIFIHIGISSTELSDLYERSKLLLVTSKAEGFCLPALEAMSHSVPVVHNNTDTLVEVCGYEIENGRNDIVQAMTRRCIDLFLDEEELRRASRSAYERSLMFSEHNFDLVLEKVLKELYNSTL